MRNFDDAFCFSHSEASIAFWLTSSLSDRMNGECRHVSVLHPNMMSPSFYNLCTVQYFVTSDLMM